MCEVVGRARDDDAAEAFGLCFPPTSSLQLDAISVDVAQAKLAASIFQKHGFVVLKRALTPFAADEVLRACRGLHAAIAENDPSGAGNRNTGRYSFNNCTPTGQCLHVKEFVEHLVDNKLVLDVLDEIYKVTPNTADGKHNVTDSARSKHPYFISRVSGDFCCGWAGEFQQLHSDMSDAKPFEPVPTTIEELDGVPIFGWFGDMPLRSPAPVHDRARPPVISVNFAPQALTRWNGPTRLVPWDEMASYHSEGNRTPPDLTTEFEHRRHWLDSRIYPLDAGDAVLRDVRVWHGGCPNLSGEARYLPCVEVSSPEYYAWFSQVFEDQHRKQGGNEDDLWWPALPCDFAKEMKDLRAKQRCNDYVGANPAEEVNLHAGDLGWLAHSVARQQWPPSFPAADLGKPASELAGFMAAVARLVGNKPAVGHDAGEKFGKELFDRRLSALEQGRLCPSWMFACTAESKNAFLALAASSLRKALDREDSHEAAVAASHILVELEEGVMAAFLLESGKLERDLSGKRQRRS